MELRGRLIELRIVAVILFAALVGSILWLFLSAGEPMAPRAALIAGGTVAAGAFAAWRLFRPVHDVLRALDHGLLGLRERDYGMRLTVPRGSVLGHLAERFNALGEVLRAERNDLYQKELILATVVESAPTAILLTDEAGLVVLDNSGARDLFLGGHRLKGHRLQEILEGCPPALARAVLGREDRLITVDRSGEPETFHVLNRFFEINTEQHTLHLIRPMTRELARQEVEVWKKTIRVINHELNNSLAPITSLVHSAQKIAERPEQAGMLREVFATIEERALHLSSFLEGYARFARLPKPSAERVSWKSFIARLQPLYPSAVQGALPEDDAWFDPGQIEQVLINLLKNAAEAGGPAEDVRLSIRGRADSGFWLAVEDRGQGMSDEVMKKALVPFFTTKASGTGLGLPLSREIVEAHGGTLTVERRPGGGTLVTCWIPGAASVFAEG
ncbi:MAG: ATP-binding protein [Myxococcota bacterium]